MWTRCKTRRPTREDRRRNWRHLWGNRCCCGTHLEPSSEDCPKCPGSIGTPLYVRAEVNVPLIDVTCIADCSGGAGSEQAVEVRNMPAIAGTHILTHTGPGTCLWEKRIAGFNRYFYDTTDCSDPDDGGTAVEWVIRWGISSPNEACQVFIYQLSGGVNLLGAFASTYTWSGDCCLDGARVHENNNLITFFPLSVCDALSVGPACGTWDESPNLGRICAGDPDSVNLCPGTVTITPLLDC